MTEKIISQIQHVSLFADLKSDSAALQKLASLMELRKYKKGDLIFSEGENGDELFILHKGVVEIARTTLEKERYVVAELTESQNAFFGELAMLDNDSRSATVLAKTDCELIVLSKKNFLDFGNANNFSGLLITRRISQILAQRLRRGNQDIVTLFEALVGEIEENS